MFNFNTEKMKSIMRFGRVMSQNAMVILCASAICLATGCKDDDANNPGSTVIPAKPIELGANLKSVSLASNNFSMRFFDAVCKQYDDNILVSPFSMQIALSMTANGAAGETKDEMMKTLGYENFTSEDMNSYNKMVTETLSSLDPQTTIEAANSVWSIPDIVFNKDFVETCVKNYDAEVDVVKFSDGSGQKRISRWAEDKTHGMIKEAGQSISSYAVVVLVNATYFAGKWANQFDKSKTANSDFFNADGSKKTVSMMHVEQAPIKMKRSKLYNIVSLPYGNGAFCMDLLLPNEGITLDKIPMDEETWNMDNLLVDNYDADISLPRFEMGVKEDYSELLQTMGIRQAFTNFADFNAMGKGDFLINSVVQETKIKVNEEGTKAAAVTSVVFKESIIANEPISIVFDHPFAFMIRETSTQTVLFAGKLMNM